MKRNAQLSSIENDALDLRDNAELFAESASNLKKQMIKKKILMIGGIILAVIVVALIIILPIVL